MIEPIKNILLGIVMISVFSYFYIKMFKASVTIVAVILIIIFLYAVCMGVCEESMKQLKKYEMIKMHREFLKKDYHKVLFFSLTTLSPTFFCVLLMASIPLFVYEVWFLTCFPCLVITTLPMNSVLEEYCVLTQKKLPFIVLFAAVIILLMSVGIAVSSSLLD